MSGRVGPRHLQIVTPEEELENLRNEVGVLRRAVESKSAAVGILRKELQECQRERDKFRTLAEQGPLHRTTPPPFIKPASCPEPSRSAMVSGSEGTLAQLLSRSKEENRTLRQDVAQLKCRLHDAQADTKVLREEVERWRGGRGRGNVGQGSLVTPPVLAQQQKEQFISQMEQLSVKCQALEGDVRGLVEEREELVRELDAASHKLHRLNHILNIVLSSPTPSNLTSPIHHQRRTVDLDAIITENRYLQQRVKQAEEEAGLARSNAAKYKAALEKCRSQGNLKLGASETLIVTPKQVSELLLEYHGEVGEAEEGDLKSLCVALVDSLNQRSRALRTQRSANKVLAGRVSELERRLSTGGGSEASESLSSSPGGRGQVGERAVVGLQLASMKLMDGYIPPSGPNRFKGNEIFNDRRLRNLLFPSVIRNEEGTMQTEEESIGTVDAVNKRPEGKVTREKNEENFKVVVVKNSMEINEEEYIMEISKEKMALNDKSKKSLEEPSISKEEDNSSDDRNPDCDQSFHHEGSTAANNMVLVSKVDEHHHQGNTCLSIDTSKQHNISQESAKSCDTVSHSNYSMKNSSERSVTLEDKLNYIPSCETTLKNSKTQKNSSYLKNVSHTLENQTVTDANVKISMNKCLSLINNINGNGEEKSSVVQSEEVEKGTSRSKESRSKRKDESCVQESNNSLKEAYNPRDSKSSSKSDSAPRESQTTLNLTDELEEIIPIDQLDSYMREVRRGAGRVGKNTQDKEERMCEVENTRVEEEHVERLDVKEVGITESNESLETRIEAQSEEKIKEVGRIVENTTEDVKNVDSNIACSDQDKQKREYSNGESCSPENQIVNMIDETSGTTLPEESDIKTVNTSYNAIYKNFYCNSDVGNYLSEDEDTSFNLDISDYDSDDDKLDAALQAWQSDVSKKDKKSGARGSRGSKAGITLANFPPFSG
ncbi:hypothetical protein Pmani_009244 [Petrolisthes manimaculis]|uniref:Uncharacterized protein n=1 Tax=Petrolisthes manimaculis TaxID=1843537 RepID=A0AAE1Q7C5_9EUCA|nr:hypothetical protein Pmani_009244 [Petrolisthes manimaculis]